MTPRTPSTEAGRRLLHMTGGWAGELVEVVLAIEAEARAPLEAERDLWKRDWGIKNDQWEKAIEARAPLEAEIDALRAALEDCYALLPPERVSLIRDTTRAALEEPTP